MSELGVLHLVKSQCHASSLVTKVKLVERCFKDGVSVRFEMYELAPTDAPAPLPYFVKPDGTIVTDELDVSKYLAAEGSPTLVPTVAGSDSDSLLTSEADVNKAIKAACKSKTAEAMTKNKETLKAALEPLKNKLSSSSFLTSDSLALADILYMADLRPAFEKVLDPEDRNSLPELTAWYERCFNSCKAVKDVWKGSLRLCEESVLDVKVKESKEEKKAREKARKKEKDAAKKVAPPAAADQQADAADKRHEAGVSPKVVDFSRWYSDVIIKGELLSYYNVPGLFVLRPASYSMWETIQKWFDERIKGVGVENCMFPLFIREDVLRKEEEHIDGRPVVEVTAYIDQHTLINSVDFAPEVAWVTHSGNDKLDERLALRPTSETAMYPYYAEWIRSHRDLPLKLNQWTNVVRMEIKQTTPFIRSKEFLWQEGHTAHATEEEAEALVLKILDWYRGIYEELMAVPVVPGWKSDKERFAGAEKTATVEAFIPETGKGVQGATSHCLGQNFAKMFNIKFQREDKEEQYVWQTSWGCTTRTLGVMVMTHSDDKGLVIPPRMSRTQVVVIPIFMATMEEAVVKSMTDRAEAIVKELTGAGIKASCDLRENYTPGHKYSHWELKGACLRIELGPKDMEKKSVVCVRRDTGKKEFIAWDALAERVPKALDEMHDAMLEAARTKVNAARVTVYKYVDFKAAVEERKCILAPWAPDSKIEGDVKIATTVTGDAESGEGTLAGAKTLCCPFQQPDMPEGQMCIFAKELLGEDRPATQFALWGRSY